MTVGRRAAHSVASATAPNEALFSEAGVIGTRLRRSAQLPLAPSLKGLWRIGKDSEYHVGVLLAAILRTLAAIDTWSVGLKPCDIGLPGNELNLSTEARHPERVDNVFALQGEPNRLSNRNVDLVRRHEGL